MKLLVLKRAIEKGLLHIHCLPDYLLTKSSRPQQRGSQQAETKQAGLPTSMLQKVVSNNSDAMNILYEAALLEEGDRGMQGMPAADSSLCLPRSLNETDALRIWNACRFVKMGWFSSYEAITLVDQLVFQYIGLSLILTGIDFSRT